MSENGSHKKGIVAEVEKGLVRMMQSAMIDVDKARMPILLVILDEKGRPALIGRLTHRRDLHEFEMEADRGYIAKHELNTVGVRARLLAASLAILAQLLTLPSGEVSPEPGTPEDTPVA